MLNIFSFSCNILYVQVLRVRSPGGPLGCDSVKGEMGISGVDGEKSVHEEASNREWLHPQG